MKKYVKLLKGKGLRSDLVFCMSCSRAGPLQFTGPASVRAAGQLQRNVARLRLCVIVFVDTACVDRGLRLMTRMLA